jgi:threonine dehydrogenase-like Zn-dependent dehydrogenase
LLIVDCLRKVMHGNRYSWQVSVDTPTNSVIVYGKQWAKRTVETNVEAVEATKEHVERGPHAQEGRMKAKAAILVAERTFEFRNVEVPADPPHGGAILAVEGCGLCGSDVEQFNGAIVRMGLMRYPTITGHEPLGRIAKIHPEGARRWGLREGDRVAIHGVAPCGVCSGCIAGGRCIEGFSFGNRSFDVGSGLWGGFCEYMEIAPSAKLYPVSERLSIPDALLYNPLAAGFDWVIHLGGLRVGDRVLVLGAGQRGLACVIAAALAGASQIIVTGLKKDAENLHLAKVFGATLTLSVEDQDVSAAVREATAGEGVDLVVDTTPNAFQPVSDAIVAVRPDGTIVLAGLKGGRGMPDFPLDMLIDKRIRILGAKSTGQWATRQAICLVESGRLPLHRLHTHKLPLTQLEYAIRLLAGEVAGERALHISMVHEQFFEEDETFEAQRSSSADHEDRRQDSWTSHYPSRAPK